MFYLPLRFLSYFAPLLVIQIDGCTGADLTNISSVNTSVDAQKLPLCTLAANNEEASSSVQNVYETTPHEEDTSENYPAVLKEVEPTENSTRSLWKNRRPKKKWKTESVTDDDSITTPHNGSFSMDNTDWTQRIFEKGQKMAKKRQETTEKALIDGPLIQEYVTTERTRSRYGWRIRKRNRKVLADEKEEPKSVDIADDRVHQTALEAKSELPTDSRTTEETPTRIKRRRMYSARFRNPNVVTSTDATPEASDQEMVAEVHGDVDAPSDGQKLEEVAEGKEDDKKEEGTGGEKGSEEHSAHNEKGSKGYENHEKEEKATKGHKDRESHTGEYDDGKGSKTEHHEDDGHYQAEDEEEGGKKGSEHEEHESYKKGHSTHGGHVVHKKDEYEKKTEFFDEDDDDGHGEKFGEYHEEHDGNKGGHHKKGHHDSSLDESHKDDKGHFEKGSHQAYDKDQEKKEGDDKHYESDQSYGKKYSHGNHNKFGHTPAQKSEGYLVSGEGQKVAIRTSANHFPMQRREDPDELEENNQDDGQYTADDGNDSDDTASYNDAEESSEEDHNEEYQEEPLDATEDDDNSGDENSADQAHTFMSEMLRRYPNAQFLDMDGPTHRQRISPSTTAPPAQYNTADFVPFRQAYQMKYTPPTQNPLTTKNYYTESPVTEAYRQNLPLRNYHNFIPSPTDILRTPTTTTRPMQAMLSHGPVALNQVARLPLPDSTSFEVLDMRGNRENLWKPLGFSLTADISPLPNQRSRRYPVVSSNAQNIDSYKVNTAYYPVSITTGPM